MMATIYDADRFVSASWLSLSYDNFLISGVGPPCPQCGKPMSMTTRKLPDNHGYEQRTVTCAECAMAKHL